MSTLLEHISRTEIVVDVDLHKPPACEGEAHQAGEDGHDGGPAAFSMVAPCCGLSVLQCAGRVHALLTWPTILFLQCDRCLRTFPVEHVAFIEL